MTDEVIRELERRAAATGATEDKAKLIQAQIRSGALATDAVFTNAARGDAPSCMALSLDPLQIALFSSLGGYGKKPRDSASAERALRAYYRAKGYTPDTRSPRALLSSDGKIRLVFTERMFEEYRGRPGAWKKVLGVSKLKQAESLVAKALGQTEKLAEKRQAERVKTEQRRTKKEFERSVLRAAAVLLSLDLSPDERFDALSPDNSRDLLSRAKRYVPEVEASLSPDATDVQIDSVLSAHAPPVFLPSDQRGDMDWPNSYRWRDATTGLAVTVQRKHGDHVAILIGNVPVNPMTGGIDMMRMAEALIGSHEDDEPDEEEDESGESVRGYTGISGMIRVTPEGNQAELYYIQSAQKRQGIARRMLRLFCRIIASYGLRRFLARGVGEEGQAMLAGLEREGEIGIVGWLGSSAVVQCTGSLDDPRQGRLFGPSPKPNPLNLDEAQKAALRGRHDLATSRFYADPLKRAWHLGVGFGRAACVEDNGPFPYVMGHEPAAIKRLSMTMLARDMQAARAARSHKKR